MRRWAVPLAVLMAAAVALPVAAQDDGRDEVEERIAELASLISDQEGRRTEIQDEITTTEERMRGIRVRLSEAQAQLQEIEDEVQTTEATSARLQRSIQLLQRQLAETRIQLHETRRQLRDRAVELYVRGSTEMPGLIFELEEVTDVAVGLSYAREAVSDTEALVRALQVLKGQEEDQQATLTSQEEEALRQLAVLEEQRALAAAEKAAVLGLRTEVERELAHQRELLDRVQRQIDEYESEKQLATEELAALERDIRSRASDSGATPGRLAWPINAPVASYFGPRVHPILGSVRPHAGIDLRAGSGTPIRAAAGGRVIMAASFGSYGNTIVIDHGGGLTTVYAHQSSFAASTGDVVETGQVIGYVGSTGYSTGPHLHFETRENGIAVDPMRYLG